MTVLKRPSIAPPPSMVATPPPTISRPSDSIASTVSAAVKAAPRPPAAVKPPAPSEQQAPAPEPPKIEDVPPLADREVPKSEEYRQPPAVDEPPRADGQITMLKLRALPLEERHALWRRLNKQVGDDTLFITVLMPEELPKQMQREHPPQGKRPVGKNVYWCCYCADWSVFEHFSYLGSHKCIGCGISTKDYYVRGANGLWKKEV